MALSNLDTAGKEEGPLYVVLLVSRNKDNKEVEGFVERKRSFVRHSVNPMTDEKLEREFINFVSHGVIGETCRLYVSVNKRDEEKAKKALMVELITRDNIKLSRIAAVTASICAKKENAAEKRWLFDFDINDEGKLEEFVSDIKKICPGMAVETHKTPHGYAVIVEHGFDTRKLFEKWTEDVTLKRDDMLLVYWDTKEKKEEKEEG